MVARLRQQRFQQPDTVQPVIGQHTPRPEVAEPLPAAADLALGIERQVSTDDPVPVPEHEPLIGRLHRPWHGQIGTCPRNLAVEIGVQEIRHGADISIGDRSNFDRHFAAVSASGEPACTRGPSPLVVGVRRRISFDGLSMLKPRHSGRNGFAACGRSRS